MKNLYQKWKLIFRDAYRLSGTEIVECLEIIDVGCNLKQFDDLTWLNLTHVSRQVNALRRTFIAVSVCVTWTRAYKHVLTADSGSCVRTLWCTTLDWLWCHVWFVASDSLRPWRYTNLLTYLLTYINNT